MRTIPSIIAYTALYGAIALYPIPTLGGPPKDCSKALQACDLALEAAEGLISTQEESIKGLKAANKELADRLADSQSAPLLPTWAYIALGAVVGVATYSIVRTHLSTP
jgi:hypothetical protein